MAAWPANFHYKDMKTVGLELSRRLRGEHGCDLIIALTHCRSVIRFYYFANFRLEPNRIPNVRSEVPGISRILIMTRT